MNKDMREFYQGLPEFSGIGRSLNRDFYRLAHVFPDDGADEDPDEMFEEYDFKDSLILETAQNALLKKKLLNKIIQDPSGFVQFSLPEILECVSRRFRQRLNVRDNLEKPVYVYKFSFSNPVPIGRIFQTFNFDFSLKQGSLKEKIKYETEVFKYRFQKAEGLQLSAGSCFFVFLNTDEFSEETVLHEMFHLLQSIRKRGIKLGRPPEAGIFEYGISPAQAAEMYSPKEFQAYIKIDLVAQLNRVYHTCYGEIPKWLFIRRFLQWCNQENPLKSNEIIRKIREHGFCDRNMTAIRLFLSTFLLANQSFCRQASQWLKQAFR